MSESPSGNREGSSEQGPEDLRSDTTKKKSADVMTSLPTNESELQLYRVLQRANLLKYYDSFISHGGDDVQQLCEAGEEEFLEIMMLVDMASKPLHVRRLQKALQEWVQNPGLFQTPLVPTQIGFHSAVHSAAAAIRGTGGVAQVSSSALIGAAAGMSVSSPALTSSLPHSVPSLIPTSVTSAFPLLSPAPSRSLSSHSPPLSLTSQPARPPSSSSPSPLIKEREPASRLTRERDIEVREVKSDRELRERVERDRERDDVSPPSSQSSEHPGAPTSPLQLTPVLVESQIQRIADTAATLVKSLPVAELEPKQPNAKKKICKELENVMSMPDEDSKKMEEIRKFSAIYGRFDAKRKPEKPLTLHEVSVNEAAAQICRLVPAMLTRRDELFPLARQVVRDSGYQYSKGHSRSTFSISNKLFNGDDGPFKRMRFSEDSEKTQWRRERVEAILIEDRVVSKRIFDLREAAASLAGGAGGGVEMFQLSQEIEVLINRQRGLMQEKDEHERHIKYSSRMSTCSDPDRPDTDDENSQRSYSNASSPSASLQQTPNYVLSASGGQIIAVQNPALSLSGAFPTRGGASPPTSSSVHPPHPPTSMTGILLASSRNLSSSPSSRMSPMSPNLKQEPGSPQTNNHRDKD